MAKDTDKRNTFEPKTEREVFIARTLGSRYEFRKRLGEGATANVYAVVNKTLDRIEALKVFSDDLIQLEGFVDRFTAEAKLCASFAHPNIVTIYDYNKLKSFYYFSMFYIDGPSMVKFTKPPDKMSVHRICTTISLISDAIDYAHQRGVIHRDIKPSNIMLDRSDKPYITDFGIAKNEQSLVKTQSGVFMGTPLYMSPEQIEGLELDGRSDIYSLGVTLYVLLTQNHPFPGKTPMSVFANRLSHPHIPPEKYIPDLPPRLREIIDRALEPDPRDRYQTAAALSESLNAFLNADTDAVKQVSSGSTGSEPTLEARRPATGKWWFAGVIAIIVMAITTWSFISKNHNDARVDASREAVERTSIIKKIPREDLSNQTKSGQIMEATDEGASVHGPVDEEQKRSATSEPDEKVVAQLRESEEKLNKLLNMMNKKFGRQDYKGCIESADIALDKLKQIPPDQQLSFSDLQIQIYQYRTKAMEQVVLQEQTQELKRLAVNTERYLQNGDYEACLDTAIIANYLIARLPDNQKRRFSGLQQKIEKFQSKAKIAKQSRQRKDPSDPLQPAQAVNIQLRSTPRLIWERDLKAMIVKHNFFESNRNKSGDFKNVLIDQTDGTVRDETTGLIWQKACSPAKLDRKAANAYIKDLNRRRFGGKSEWRLPTIEELASLLENQPPRNNGSYIHQIFQHSNVPHFSRFWSADSRDPGLGYRHSAWIVNFNEGTIMDASWSEKKDLNDFISYVQFFVRAVSSSRSSELN